MKKMVTTSSSLTSAESPIDFLTNSSEETIAAYEGVGRLRYSAIFGLAISLGASSFLMANLTQPAFASDAITPQTNPVEKNDSNPSLIKSRSTSTLKHEVKAGETLFSLSQNYQIEAEAIAKINDLNPQTELIAGQTLKIPTSEQLSPRSEKVSSVALDQSLNNLRESRRKLQESLAALRSNQIVEQPTLIAQTPTSEQQTTPQSNSEPTAEIDDSSSLAIELNRPIPIAVPTPETDVTQFATEPTVIPVPEVTTATVPKTLLSPSSNQSEKPTSEAPTSPSVAIQTPKLITPGQETVYRVQAGDTLNTIAESHGISVQALEEANQITDPNMIRVNQSLIIPGTGSEQPSLNSKLPPVPQVKSITPTAVTTTSYSTVQPRQEVPSVPSNAIPLSVESVPQTQTEKLRADFAHLEQAETRQTQPTQVSIAIPVESNAPQAIAPQSRDSEWEHDRNSVFKRSQNIKAKPTDDQPTLVGTATIPVEPYIDDLRIPVGTTVDPDLPSLSNPNQYLPETPPVLQGFIWPARGVLSSGYGRRWGRMHRGIDIAAPIGTPVIASASGEVVSAGWNSGGYGNLVKLKHADGSITFYAHNSRLLVRAGQQIEQGQQIAQMGSTGFSTGPHLHFEVHPNGQGAVNPIAFLPKKERR